MHLAVRICVSEFAASMKTKASLERVQAGSIYNIHIYPDEMYKIIIHVSGNMNLLCILKKQIYANVSHPIHAYHICKLFPAGIVTNMS